MTYAEKLLDPRWQKKRLEIFNRDGWACKKCGSKTITLHVHHSFYRLGFEPWDYPQESLSTLCELCHKQRHGLDNPNVRLQMDNALLSCVKGRGRCEEVLRQCIWRLDPFDEDPNVFWITVSYPPRLRELASIEIDEKVMMRFLSSAQSICNRVSGSQLVEEEIDQELTRIGGLCGA